MVAGVLTQTTSLDRSSQNHPRGGDEWREYSASLLPDRGDTHISYSPCQGRTPWVQTHRCNPMGLASSPQRIEPHCEKGHPREVKNREGKEPTRHQRTPTVLQLMVGVSVQGNLRVTSCISQLMGVALARTHPAHLVDTELIPERPDSRTSVRDLSEVSSPLQQGGGQTSPTYGWGLSGRQVVPVRERKWIEPNFGQGQLRDESTNTRGDVLTSKNNWELPPLPERAIRGLTSPWSSPNGEPFHTVSLWEFTNLYVLLGKKDWQTLSKFLKGMNLSVLSRQLKIGYPVLLNIRDNHDQSIVVPNLRKLCKEAELNLDSVERSIRGVRFNTRGSVERLQFPFAMDIYAWRTLCHVAGDGNVHDRDDRPFPYLRWTQLREDDETLLQTLEIPPKNQRYMRALLERLSRYPGGYSDNVNYPKALSYAIMGAIPSIVLDDLRSPTFIQCVLDLPPSYRDFKVQFLAAFAFDDAGIDQTINFFQKSLPKLELVMKLCKQLNYEYSNHPYVDERGVWSFRLLLRGIRCFYNDLIDIQKRHAWDPILGLWHKSHSHKNIVENISDKRLEENQRAIIVYESILKILSDHLIRSSKQLRKHPKLQPLVENYSSKVFGDRLRWLVTHDLIQEVKKPNGGSYRPKRWVIPPSRDLETLIKEFHAKFGNRAHKQSYKRKDVTVEMAKSAMARLITRGVKPNPTNTSREGGFSRKLIYERDDLRALFEDEE